MAVPLTVSEITNMIGVEQAIIQQTLERRDEDLAPYLCDPNASTKRSGCQRFPLSNVAFRT